MDNFHLTLTVTWSTNGGLQVIGKKTRENGESTLSHYQGVDSIKTFRYPESAIANQVKNIVIDLIEAE